MDGVVLELEHTTLGVGFLTHSKEDGRRNIEDRVAQMLGVRGSRCYALWERHSHVLIVCVRNMFIRRFLRCLFPLPRSPFLSLMQT